MNNVGFEKFQKIPVEKMIKAEWNYKKEDNVLSRILEGNMKRNGQIENIIVREMEDGIYEVVNGNHRYDVLKRLNEEEAVVYNLGKISLAEAKRIAIETNETKFSTNPALLAKVVDDILTEFSPEDFLDSAPFSKEQLEDFQRMIEPFSWEGADIPNGHEVVPKQAKSINIKLSRDIGRRFATQVEKILTMNTGPADETKKMSNIIKEFVNYLQDIDNDVLYQKANRINIVELDGSGE